MPNGDYWKKRMEAIEKISHDRGADYAEYVKKQFEDSIRTMEKEIEVWYGRIADNNDFHWQQLKNFCAETSWKISA